MAHIPLTQQKAAESEPAKPLRWSEEEMTGILAAWEEFKRTGSVGCILPPCNESLRRGCLSVARAEDLDEEALYVDAHNRFIAKLEKIGLTDCSTSGHVLGRLADFTRFALLNAQSALRARRKRERSLADVDALELRDQATADIDDEEEREIERGLYRECVTEVLKAREYEVVALTYSSTTTYTQVQIAALIGVTDRAVRDLLNKALQKLIACCHAKRVSRS